MSYRRTAFAMLLPFTLHACGTRYLPPPRAPQRVAPAVGTEVPPVREGEGQITLDVEGGPARADLVTGRTQILTSAQGWGGRGRYTTPQLATQLATRPLCVTPCTVNLPLGPHEIAFAPVDEGSDRGGTGYVNVGSRPSVVRHAMGFNETHVGGLIGAIMLVALGTSAVVSGAVLEAFEGSAREHGSDFAVAGGVTLGIGAAMVGLGSFLGWRYRPTYQPGSTTQWTP